MQRYTNRLVIDLDIPPPPAAPFKGKEMNRHLCSCYDECETVHEGVRSYTAPHIV